MNVKRPTSRGLRPKSKPPIAWITCCLPRIALIAAGQPSHAVKMKISKSKKKRLIGGIAHPVGAMKGLAEHKTAKRFPTRLLRKAIRPKSVSGRWLLVAALSCVRA
jgi:hypothetical protein